MKNANDAGFPKGRFGCFQILVGREGEFAEPVGGFFVSGAGAVKHAREVVAERPGHVDSVVMVRDTRNGLIQIVRDGCASWKNASGGAR